MRPLLPIAAAVLLTVGAAAIPALTQAQSAQSTSVKHYKWKKTNIDVAAMSASMSAQNPNAFAPSTATAGDAATDQQPGAIAPNAHMATLSAGSQSANATSSDSGVMGNSALTGAQNSPTSPSDDSSMTAPDKSTSTGTSASPQ
jgi:hypothetical protein